MAPLQINRFKNHEECCEAVTSAVLEAARVAVEERGIFLLGAAGGSTPRLLYEHLAGRLNLKKTEVFLVDERNVPHDDARSNYKLLKESLFSADTKCLPHLHDFQTSLDLDQADCMQKYELEIESLAPDGLDFIILGLGRDGHFASIFQGTDFEIDRPVLASETLVNEVKERYSLSVRYILKAKTLLILMTGQDKLAVLEELEHGEKTEQEFPAKLLLKHPDLTIFFGQI